MEQKNNNKTNDDFMKKIIIFMGIFLFCFVVVVLGLFYLTGGMEPSTLIVAVFAACMGEGSICGFLKISKNKKELEEKKANVHEGEGEESDELEDMEEEQ